MLISQVTKVDADRRILPRRAWKVVAEPAPGHEAVIVVERHDLGLDPSCRAHRRHVRTALGKRDEESGRLEAIVGHACPGTTDARITRSREDGDAARAQLSKRTTDALGVCWKSSVHRHPCDHNRGVGYRGAYHRG